MADGHLRTIKCAIENAQKCLLQDKDSCPTVALSKVRQAFDVHSILNDSHAIPAEESGDIRRSLSALETALKNEIEMNRRESSNDFAFSARRIPTGIYEPYVSGLRHIPSPIAIRPSPGQQFFSHVGTEPLFPG